MLPLRNKCDLLYVRSPVFKRFLYTFIHIYFFVVVICDALDSPMIFNNISMDNTQYSICITTFLDGGSCGGGNVFHKKE